MTTTSGGMNAFPVDKPMLQVNLGNAFARGGAAHLEFHLICPGYEGLRPSVTLSPPPTLDADCIDRRPQLSTEEPGHWSFTQSFILSLRGNPCPPGSYAIRIDVEFHTAADANAARFRWATVPFRVIDSKEHEGRELIVDLDKLAILDGVLPIDPADFGKVVLRAGEKAIVSLDTPNTTVPPRTGKSFNDQTGLNCVQLPLKPNLDRVHLAPPRVSTRFAKPHAMDSAALVFEDGRRTLLLTKKQIKLGRQPKTNDIVLWFMPPNERHNKLSQAISREHLSMELTASGLSVSTTGRFGTTVNCKSIESILLGVEDYAGETIDMQLGTDKVQVEQPFHLALQLFRWDSESGDQSAWADWDHWYFETVGARRSSTYKAARSAGLDAVRIQRKTNQPEEEYVLAFRQVLIGPSHDRCPVYVPDPVNARILYIDKCFWLENVGEPTSIQVQGESLSRRELVPLVPGMSMTLGETAVRFEEFAQLHL